MKLVRLGGRVPQAIRVHTFFPVFGAPNQGDSEQAAYGTSYPSFGSSDRPFGSGAADVGAQAGLQAMMGT